MRLGKEILGSSAIQTSKANQEVVPDGVYFYKFSFMNNQDCTVIINGGEPIFLKEGFGFSSDSVDPTIDSFVIVEPNIEYFWVGGV